MNRSDLSPLETPFRALPAHGGEGTLFACSLCGFRFSHGGRVCGSCPMSTGCELVKCPHCGFQFPRTSSVADAFTRLWRKLRRKSP